MRYLLDTGILARLPHRTDPQHGVVRDAVRHLVRERHTLVAGTQNIAEFWGVCTRPAQARGGFGLTIEEASHRLRILERLLNVLKEPDSAYAKWKLLVIAHRVSGKQVHDARLVALMSAHRIRRILTLNPADFSRYPIIRPLTPAEVLSA